MSNSNLRKAAGAKNDEFYTRLTDIEKEMAHYKRHFKGKTVFCPCDDPHASKFFQYFSKNFEHLGLKRLITACYKSTNPLGMSLHDDERAMWLEYNGDANGNRVPDPDEIGVHHFDGDGDFRSHESLALLRTADIIVTNPPFSLFRDFMDLMIAEKKKFLVVGNFNAVSYKKIWSSILSGNLWLGVNHLKEFITPGGDIAKFGNVVWFTNLNHPKRNDEIVCYRRFNRADYPKYDFHNAVEVSKVKDIPTNYNGIMGVPITFLEKWNPKQFEILGLMNTGEKNPGIRYPNTPTGDPVIDGVKKYARILIRHRAA